LVVDKQRTLTVEQELQGKTLIFHCRIHGMQTLKEQNYSAIWF